MFQGEHLDKGVSAGDYTVYVGKGVCLVQEASLNSTILSCQPPDPIPEPSIGTDGKYRDIVVRMVMSANICS
jgi:ABC-type microcin C transport system permease subunit YejE